MVEEAAAPYIPRLSSLYGVALVVLLCHWVGLGRFTTIGEGVGSGWSRDRWFV